MIIKTLPSADQEKVDAAALSITFFILRRCVAATNSSGSRESSDHCDLHHEPEFEAVDFEEDAEHLPEKAKACKPYMRTSDAVIESVSALFASQMPAFASVRW